MDAIQKAVVARLVKAEESKEVVEGMKPGEYKGEFMARIAYAFKRGEDFDKAIPAKAKPWKLLALALSKLNGVTVASLVREAEGGVVVEEADIEARANEAIATVVAATKTRCNGQVRGTFSLDIVPTLEVR
jgi:hypothetical protein